MQILHLAEHESRSLAKDAFTDKWARYLWEHYPDQIDIDEPSLKTGDQWKLTSQGWVGYIPLTDGAGLTLEPKVPLQNIFRMLEYAYRLRSFRILDELMDAGSLQDFFERLANILADRILDRVRKGLFRTYRSRRERLPYLRGRIDIAQAVSTPWQLRFPCRYREHTGDVEDNQILMWTLDRLARSGIRRDDVRASIRKAHHALQGAVTVTPFSPRDCTGRTYNRLNQDYDVLHALCRFFLENTGPTHMAGDHGMVPFLVNMDRLFELFVAEWMKVHLPNQWSLEAQDRVTVGSSAELRFDIDLVVRAAGTADVACVLDTKYKSGKPTPADVAQVVAYAELRHTTDAVLIYPVRLDSALTADIGSIGVRSVSFSLDGDLGEAGQKFLTAILPVDARCRP